MDNMVLCDTNILIYAFNGRQETISQLQEIGLEQVVLSVITVMELYQGMAKKEADYIMVMSKIDDLMAKGRENVTKEELAEIRKLALAAQQHEKAVYVLDPPGTLAGMIELRMFELRLKQKDLAKKLNISNAKLSLILNGKQRPDVDFLKSVHSELNVDADFLLAHA